jgi:hypothetical protein
MGYIAPLSPFAYTGSVQGPNITVLSSLQSGTLGSLVMAQGMPTWVSRSRLSKRGYKISTVTYAAYDPTIRLIGSLKSHIKLSPTFQRSFLVRRRSARRPSL